MFGIPAAFVLGLFKMSERVLSSVRIWSSGCGSSLGFKGFRV